MTKTLKTLIAGIALLTGASAAQAAGFTYADARPAIATSDFSSTQTPKQM